MGISANQARLMTLTARQHDLELRAQQISAGKMIKGLESQEAAMDYSRALNNYSIIKQIETLPDNDKGWVANVSNGVLSYGECPDGHDPREFGATGYGVTAGNFLKEIANANPNLFYNLGENLDAETFLQVAKAEYEAFTTSVSAQEKLLDMELTQINTEHSAVKTEYDSIKGLVGENVDKSFNVFG